MDRSERLDDPDEMMRQAFAGMQAKLWTAMPGIVSSVNLAAQTCEVQPAVQGEVDDAQGNTTNVNMPLLLDCPIVFPRAGGFAVTFPMKIGDEVLVVLASRCIDSWWQSGQVQPAAEFRMHDLSDGFAIPGPTSQPKALSAVSTTNMQMRTEDGAAYIEMTPAGGVRIVCSSYQVVSSGAATTEAATWGVVSAGAASIDAPTLTNNDKNIGDDHVHAGSPTAPNGPVSDTGAPT